jgi:Tfp pilus assembly protein PilN
MYLEGQGKTAVALFVDGLELKYVQLSTKGDVVTLRDFKTVALISKFEEKETAAVSSSEEPSFGDMAGGDAMAPPPDAALSDEGGSAPASNSTVLLSLLSDLPPTKYTFSFALSEPAVTFQEFESDFGLKGTKLKKKLIQEISSTRSSAPRAIDSIEIIPTATGGVLSIVREDGLHLYDLLTDIRSFLGGRLPLVKSIDSADTALMGLVRASYELAEDEITVIVYVGHDYSRLIFMQGSNYLHFAPIISEGYGSANVENTIYSRILLEQDNIALSRVDRIILAGESHKINMLEALAPQFPHSTVEYIRAPDLDLSAFDGQVGEQISEYAVPIVAAWQALSEKAKGFYHTNLIPNSIIEGQKVFKLAWHGWLAALSVIFAIVFFYTSILKQNATILEARNALTKKQARLADIEVLQQREATLNADIKKYQLATAVYDSLAPGSDRWSRVLHYLANSIEDLNSVWIYSLRKDAQNPNGLVISGRSVYRTRIPRLASVFEKATLKEVRTTTIRGKIIYDFDILVEQVDKGDAPAGSQPGGQK